jgi:hypothetical protein
MKQSARLYAYAVITAGGTVLAATLSQWSSSRFAVCLVFLAVTALTSLVKLRLPHINGNYSLNFLVLLYGLARFSLAELVVAGCVAAAVQSLCNAQKRPQPIQVFFNMANISLSLAFCFLLRRALLETGIGSNPAALMSAIACAYFVVNTLLVSGVLALLQGKSLSQTCGQWYLWSFPYYLVGAALVGLTLQPQLSDYGEGWLILVPLVYLIHFFFGLAELQSSQKVASQTSTAASLPHAARIYLVAVITAGGCLLWAVFLHWQMDDPQRFVIYLTLAVAASTLKIRLPGLTGTLSPNFVLLLVAVAQLSLSEAVLIGMASAAVQSLWKPKHWPKPEQVLFNAASLALSTALAYAVSHQVMAGWLSHSLVGCLVLATLLLYGTNTLIVAVILCLVDQKPLHHLWQLCHFWSFPYYLIGAAVAGLMTATASRTDWLSALPILSLMTLVYVCYRSHLGQVVQ